MTRSWVVSKGFTEIIKKSRKAIKPWEGRKVKGANRNKIVQRFKDSNMKTYLISALALIMTFGLFSSINAQAVRNGVERAQDHNQIQKDKATIDRDRSEIKQFKAYRAGLYNAVDNGKPAVAKGFHTKLVAAMETEIKQGKAKIAQAQREVNQSTSEVRSDRRELRNTRGTGRPLATADDRRDKRDDQADLRDDKADRAELKVRNARQEEILAVFRAVKVEGPNDFTSLRTKRALLEEFEQTMVRDMGENWEELREDKIELNEDRRETREDRRQR